MPLPYQEASSPGETGLPPAYPSVGRLLGALITGIIIGLMPIPDYR